MIGHYDNWARGLGSDGVGKGYSKMHCLVLSFF